MTVLEILQKRKKLYVNDLQKTCFTEEVRRETHARIEELNNLIFIINTQNITGIK